MSDNDRVAALENGMLAVQQQLATVTQLLIQNSGGAQTQPTNKASEPLSRVGSPKPEEDLNPADSVGRKRVMYGNPDVAKSGTLVKDGRWDSNDVFPSSRDKMPHLAPDPVDAYFKKKRYGALSTTGGTQEILPSPRGHELVPATAKAAQQDNRIPVTEEQAHAYDDRPPVSAAEEADENDFSDPQEKVAEETLVDFVENLPTDIKGFTSLVLGEVTFPTVIEYLAFLKANLTTILGREVSRVKATDADEAFLSVLDKVEEPYVRTALIAAREKFVQYVSEIENTDGTSTPSEELQEFLGGVKKEDLSSVPTTMKVMIGGGEEIAFAKGLWLSDSNARELMQFFVLGGKNVNPQAVDFAKEFLTNNTIFDDVIVITIPKGPTNEEYKYSIRYKGHEKDSYGNLVVWLEDGASMTEDLSIPNLGDYGL